MHVALLLLLFFAVYQMRELGSILVLSYVIALIFDPMLTRLEKYGVRRTLSAVALMVLGAGLLVSCSLWVFPKLVSEYDTLSEKLPEYLRSAVASGSTEIEKVTGVTLPESTDALGSELQHRVQNLSGEQVREIWHAALNWLFHGYSMALTLLNLLLFPLFVFYCLRDLHVIHRFILRYIPADQRPTMVRIGREIAGRVQTFFRGQIFVCLLMGLLYALGLTLIGLDNGFVVGLLSGFLGIVPYLGLTVGVILGSLIAIFNAQSMTLLLLVLAVFAAVQVLEGVVLTPKIQGERLGIHPLGVLLAIIIGGKSAGILGLLLAIPVTAALMVIAREWGEAE